jgi:hypothetical protein
MRIFKTIVSVCGFVFLPGWLISQPEPSSSTLVLESVENREGLRENSIFNDYPARNIGPVVQGGRVVDLAVNPNNFYEYYVAYASGGLFKTTNNGASFKPVFDNTGTLTIGDIAIAPSDEAILYVGTGENNSSRSSYAGCGVFRSDNAGESWEYVGLEGIQHTGRIVVHPDNPDVVWVAAMGALYSKNDERGIYKTIDGGKNWQKVFFLNDSTGAIDLIIHPENPDKLWAAFWERDRKADNFKESGPNSGIYRTTDGGDTWEKSHSGLPEGKIVGRIGLDISVSNPNILFAVVDNQTELNEEKTSDQKKLSAADFVEMSNEEFLNLDNDLLDEFLQTNRFPKKYTSALVKQEVKEGKYVPKALTEYLFGDANKALLETRILGAEVYRSVDEGRSWEKVNQYDLERVYNTYGYYFGQIDVDPQNPETVYVHGVPFLKSNDGGKTFARADTVVDVHADHHALWINPKNSRHMLNGNDGGVYVTYDQGENWTHLNNTAVGQFYTVNVDMEKPYNVYGGLQDNGVLKGSSQSVPNKTKYWEKIFGGDGMFVAADPANSNTVFTGFQFGNYYRLDLKNEQYTRITPQHDIGEKPLRFNWRTPVILSKHNPEIMYFASQHVHRSFNQGESWEVISADLTTDQPQGNVPYSTIVSLVESPLKFELIYAGTDDGKVWVLKGAGTEWQDISKGLPEGLWVSSIYPSTHSRSEVFLSLNGYRNDHFETYVYHSDDYGKTWNSIASNVKGEVVNVVLQDLINPDLLYLGTDHATYISFNKGKQWDLFPAIPNVASYDMVVHPRENELVVGTHGRSIYVVDVKPFQYLKTERLNDPITMFETGAIQHGTEWGKKPVPYVNAFEPKATLRYFTPKKTEWQVDILDDEEKSIRNYSITSNAGFNAVNWDLKYEVKKGKERGKLKYVGKGKYTVRLSNGDDAAKTSIEIK